VNKKYTVETQTLWNVIEVYMALKQPDVAAQIDENMRGLFHYNEYTHKYILLTKRGLIQTIENNPIPSPTLIPTSPNPEEIPKDVFHLIKKGETPYQLSKRYGVTAPELMF
jgi:hypothetical protein